jgi:NAD(P)-dependent dehydrogenase (short-subunit alcohol dehydrogenase family)
MAMLENKVAFITGASSGIGAGTARRFRRGRRKDRAGRCAEEEGHKLQQEIENAGGQALYVECDVSSPEAVQAAITAAVEKFGRLDIVFANAGINGVWTPIQELKPEEWDKTININLKGTYLTVHYAVPHLKAAGGGSILITSSVNGTRLSPIPAPAPTALQRLGRSPS